MAHMTVSKRSSESILLPTMSVKIYNKFHLSLATEVLNHFLQSVDRRMKFLIIDAAEEVEERYFKCK